MLQLLVVLGKSSGSLSLVFLGDAGDNSNVVGLVLIEIMTTMVIIVLAILSPSHHLVHSSHNLMINASHQQVSNTFNLSAQVVQQAKQLFKHTPL